MDWIKMTKNSVFRPLSEDLCDNRKQMEGYSFNPSHNSCTCNHTKYKKPSIFVTAVADMHPPPPPPPSPLPCSPLPISHLPPISLPTCTHIQGYHYL